MIEKVKLEELAVAVWRLERWLDNLKVERKMAGVSALRVMKRFLSDLDVEVRDPLGAKFDPGLAIEVVNNEAEDAPEETLVIIETISPYVYQAGMLVKHAKVIIGTELEMKKEKNGTKDVTEEILHEKEHKDYNVDEEAQISTDDIERMMDYASIL